MEPRVFRASDDTNTLYVQWSKRGPFMAIREGDGVERFTLPPVSEMWYTAGESEVCPA